MFFILGVDDDENEIGILEFIHCLVETMDRFVYPYANALVLANLTFFQSRYFENVCELDIMTQVTCPFHMPLFCLHAAHTTTEGIHSHLPSRTPNPASYGRRLRGARADTRARSWRRRT